MDYGEQEDPAPRPGWWRKLKRRVAKVAKKIARKVKIRVTYRRPLGPR